jgi:hypothetical protein
MKSWGTLDYIILGILALAFLVGFCLGYGKHGPKRLCFIAAFLAAYFFGTMIADALMRTRLGYDMMVNAFVGVFPNDAAFQASLSGISSSAQQALMGKALSEINVPVFFQSFVTTRATMMDTTVRVALASGISFWILAGIFFVVLFVLVFIVLDRIFSGNGKDRVGLFGENGTSLFGRLAGGVHWVMKGTILLFLLMLVVVFISQMMASRGLPVLQDYLEKVLDLENGNSYSPAQLFYNTAATLLNWITLRLA